MMLATRITPSLSPITRCLAEKQLIIRSVLSYFLSLYKHAGYEEPGSHLLTAPGQSDHGTSVYVFPIN